MTGLICQAVGCTHARTPSQFMCTSHWRALPQPLRTQVNATWRAWKRRAGDGAALWLDYIVARDEARRWTAEGEGRLALFEQDAPRIRALQEARRG